MKIDFLNDVKNIIINNLEFMGCSLPKNQEFEHLILCYKNIENKHIVPRKRIVSFSKEISCNQHLKQFTNLINKIENGDEVNCFLSKKMRHSEYQDKLLNDWGIHHLHYKTERSDQLLFVMFNENHTYFIDIMPHENYKKQPNKVTWANSKLIQIIHSNWPNLLSRHKINGVDECNLTNQQRKSLRDFNSNAPITMSDGTTYCVIGGGLTSTGHCIRHIRDVDSQRQYIEYIQENFKKVYQEKLINQNVQSVYLESIEMDQNKEIHATIKVIFPNKNKKIFIDLDIKSWMVSYVLVNY
jgi:hypothetical protein